MSFQQVELREGKSLVTNQAQFIRAAADMTIWNKGSSRRHQAEHSVAFMQLQERTTKPGWSN